MASVADIDRVSAIVRTLDALGNVRPGDVIQAQQWNDLVGAVKGLAHAVLGAREETVPPHDHTGQVKLSWLDAPLRAMVEKGRSDPVLDIRFVEVERKLQVLDTRVAQVSAAAADAAGNVVRLNTRVFERDADFTEVHRKIETFDARKDEITSLRDTLGGIQERVDRAARVATRLDLDAQPDFDLRTFIGRVEKLEELPKRLTTATGELLDVQGFETRISDLQKKFVTQAQLDVRLEKHEVTIPPSAFDQVRETLSTTIRKDLDQQIVDVRQQIRNETDTKLATVDETVVKRLGERLPKATEELLATVRTDIDRKTSDTLEAARQFTIKQANESAGGVRRDLDKRITETVAAIDSTVLREVDKIVPNRLSEIEKLARAAREDATSALTRANSHGQLIEEARTKIASIELKTGRDITGLRDTINSEFLRRDAATRAIENRVVEFEGKFDARVDTRVNERLVTFEEKVAVTAEASATRAANNAVASRELKLRTDMADIARDEARSLKDEIRESVRKDIDPLILRSVNAEVGKLRPRPTGGG